MNDDEDLAVDVIQIAEERLGDQHFGGGWLDRSNASSPVIGIAAVEPSQADIEAILALPRPRRWRTSVSLVRYSRAELISFYDHLVPPARGGAASSFGWDVRLNRVVVTLNKLDRETVEFFQAHVPPDALQFVVEPGRWASAYPDVDRQD